MIPFDAWWIPGYQPSSNTEWLRLPGQSLDARVPRLTSSDVLAIASRLRQARASYLGLLSVDEIVQKVGAAISRWLDPFSSYLHEACRAIPAYTGYSEEATRKGLAGYLASLRAENLRRMLRDELGDPEVLDGFRPRPAAPGLTRATGPGLVVHSFAGNVPGLPAQSLVAAILVKSASLGKIASEEPIFPALFARSIAAIDSRLGDCLAVTYWPGEDREPGDTAFGLADAIVAYGSNPAITSVRGRVPEGRRFIAYKHKLSFAVILRERLRTSDVDDLAERAAYDVSRFDQQGCLSPHVIYVEEGGEVDAEAFGRSLAVALDRWSHVVPRGRLTSDESRRVSDVRREHEFRSALSGGAVYGGSGAEWCVLVDRDPTFAASCLNRTVWVKPLSDAVDLTVILDPVQQFVQTAGVAATPDRIEAVSDILAGVGLDRICPLGQMGDPPSSWHHDGRFNVLDLLRFTDLEPESTSGRWEFGHPERGLLGRERRTTARGEPTRVDG